MFNDLKLKIQKKFKDLADTGKLFYVEIDREKIWECYIEGFTDPLEKQGHNCNCCKSFLRQYGGLVTIVDNKVQSIWDIEVEELYEASIKNLRQYIHSLPITDVYQNSFDSLGTDKNLDKVKSVTWNHFFVKLPIAFVNKNALSIDSLKSTWRDNKSVLKRSLDELTIDATETILELIAQGSLYKGNEFEGILTGFLKLQKEYKKVPAAMKDNFCWIVSTEVNQALTRVRNTAIGTLLVNLSEGMELDTAVSKFEVVVAPSNYKRPTALVTPRMIEEAKTKLSEAGLLESLERRFATSTDLDIKDILYVDKSSSLSDVFEDMKKDSEVNPKSFSKIEEIGINDFLENVLPKTKKLSVLLENRQLSNMVTLLTSVNKEAPLLFKHNNPFSWSYTGGITDSMKERVKEAGGKIDGVLRFSIQWNEDGKSIIDLDAHAHEPVDGSHIYYSSPYRKDQGRGKTIMTGQLDVDMINPSHVGIENITWSDQSKMKEGTYKFRVHNYSGHKSFDGVRTEIEFDGEIHEFSINKPFINYVDIAEVTYSKVIGFSIKSLLEGKSTINSKEKWGLKTNRFHKIKNIMLSPNYWGDNKVGNKHFMFILEHCESNESTRPFFNEFLKEEFNSNRKFFEVLGSKLKLNPPTNQVSGIGFSDTQRSSMIVQVEGSFKRVLKINF